MRLKNVYLSHEYPSNSLHKKILQFIRGVRPGAFKSAASIAFRNGTMDIGNMSWI